MTDFTWTTSARLSVSGLAGWAPVERMEVPHSSGRAVVRVERFPAAPDADLDTLAALHGDSVAVEGWTDSGLSIHEVLGSAEGRTRTVTWADDDGTRFDAVIRYALERGSLVVLSTVTPAGDATLAREAATIAESVHVVRPVEMTETTLPLRPGQVDFSEVAAAWRAGTRPEPGAEHVITTEESFGAAQHFGVAMLPGADTSQWDQLDPAQRDLVAAVVWRSLEARGAGSGTDLAEALELAASHDLIVMASERDDDQVVHQWFAARADRMVRLQPFAPGLMVLTTHATADLADLLLAGSRGAGTTVTASAVYRSEGHAVGDETAWAGNDAPDLVREALGRLVTGTRTRSAS